MRGLSVQEVESVNGGAHPVVAFVAGALTGGVIYDVAKAGVNTAIDSAGRAAGEAMQRYYSELFSWQMSLAPRNGY